MQYIVWIDEKYALKIPTIDEQHRFLIDTINEIFNAKRNSVDRESIAGILAKLFDYAKFHFETEERLMKEVNYSGLDEHIIAHRMFSKKVEGFKQNFDSNEDFLLDSILEFLKNWLLHHIMEIDKKYVPFILSV